MRQQAKRNNIVRGIADRLCQAVEFYEETERYDRLDNACDLWEQAQRFCTCHKHNLFSNDSIADAYDVLIDFASDLEGEGEDPKRVMSLVRDIAEYLAA